MPTYEYRCRDCGQHVEVVQSFTDEPLRTCGACGGDLRKVFSPIGITFKGSGFYKTDSRSSSAKSESAKSDGGGEKADKADKAEKTAKAETTGKSEIATPAKSGSEAKSA